MRAYDAAAFVLLVVPALLVMLSFLPWALHREAGMCDQELHRGKYVCVHDVPWALHQEAGMCDQEGSRHV